MKCLRLTIISGFVLNILALSSLSEASTVTSGHQALLEAAGEATEMYLEEFESKELIKIDARIAFAGAYYIEFFWGENKGQSITYYCSAHLTDDHLHGDVECFEYNQP